LVPEFTLQCLLNGLGRATSAVLLLLHRWRSGQANIRRVAHIYSPSDIGLLLNLKD
jgi:hypothetical protein